MQSIKTLVKEERIIEISLEDMIELIRSGESVDILYKENPNPIPNVITLVCGDKFTNDIREIHPVISTHSPVQIRIRGHEKDKDIISWREYYVMSPSIYSQFKINRGS